jgi:hypothetical protein
MQNGVLCTRALGFALLESKNLVFKRLPVIGSLYSTPSLDPQLQIPSRSRWRIGCGRGR